MSTPPPFRELAADPDPPLDLLALAVAAEFRGVDATRALAHLDALAAELAAELAISSPTAAGETEACVEVLGVREGFAGDRRHPDDPANSMLDEVLERRRGLPILLSVLYAEVARRAGVPLAGIGLSGHFVVGHFGAQPALMIDPFAGGGRVRQVVPAVLIRPWTAKEIAMRMLNNLIPAFEKRGHLGSAIHAASLRLLLPAEPDLRDALAGEHRALRSRMN